MTIEAINAKAKEWGVSYGYARARLEAERQANLAKYGGEIERLKKEIDELHFIYTCKKCGVKFKRKGEDKLYCDTCRKQGFVAFVSDNRPKRGELVTKKCIRCGEEFSFIMQRMERKYCSNSCAHKTSQITKQERNQKLKELTKRLEELIEIC